MQAQAAGMSVLNSEPADLGGLRWIFSGRDELSVECAAIDNGSPAGVHFCSSSGGNSTKFPSTVISMA
jgi:hypothetical protein